MRRLLAVVVAAGMVVGSLALRARLDENEEDRARPLRLTCSAELDAVCQKLREAPDGNRLELTVEAAGQTADRLAGADGDPGLDGWLVPEPWPELVDGRRRRSTMPPLFATDRRPLARSPLVLVVWKERGAALASRCGGPVNWRCLGDAAAAGPWTASGGRAEWGALKPGHGEPTSDGVGLLVLGSAVAAWFGRPDVSTIDLDDDAFAKWFSALEQAVPPSPSSPLQQMLAVGPAQYDAAGTVEAEAGPLLARSPRRSAVDLLYPSPMATADVVLATTGSGSVPQALRSLSGSQEGRQALAGAGWRVEGEEPAQGVATSPLPATNGLPSGGLLDALRSRSREATGR